MSILEFISSVAWPVTVLAIVLLFRQSFSEMLSGPLRRLKAGPVEAVWQDMESEIKAELSSEPGQSRGRSTADMRTASVSDELSNLAEKYPPAAILDAYEQVRRALVKALEDPPLDAGPKLDDLSVPQLAELALEGGRIHRKTAQAARGLSVLRNLAAHGRGDEVTEARAHEYLALVDATLFAIETNHRELTQEGVSRGQWE